MDSIKILELTYKIKRVPFISRVSWLAGQIDLMAQEILIDEAISAEREKTVILHEMLHGILSDLMYHEESNNETFVQSLALALHQCLRDNPDLLKF